MFSWDYLRAHGNKHKIHQDNNVPLTTANNEEQTTTGQIKFKDVFFSIWTVNNLLCIHIYTISFILRNGKTNMNDKNCI